MNKKTFTVSVGIPAYNEEANIKYLLNTILGQKEDNFILKEIIIISDGSSDKTAEIARAIHDKRVIVLENSKSLGKPYVQNQLIQLFKGDILVILDGDVLACDDHFIAHMVAPFYSQDRLGLVAGRVLPLPAENSFERVINFSVELKQELYEHLNKGDNVYLCHGRARAFSRALISNMVFPPIFSEDAFSYITCKEKSYLFSFQYEAVVFYRSPQNFEDHYKQSARFFRGLTELSSRMSRKTIRKYHYIPLPQLLRFLSKYFLKHPILFVRYIVISIYVRSLLLMHKDMPNWDQVVTSKILKSKSLV